MHTHSRGIRRASLTVALGLTGLAAFAPVAGANTSVIFGTGPEGSGVSWSDDSASSNVAHADLLRGGSVVASADGFSFGVGRFVSVQLPSNVTLAAGDQVQIAVDGSTQTFSYDGTPAINADACNGATSFTGTVNAAAASLDIGAYSFGAGSAFAANPATVDRSGTTFTAKLERALATDDAVFVDQVTAQNGVDVFSTTMTRTPATCPAPPATTPTSPGPAQTPTSTPAPKTTLVLPTLTQIVTGLQSTLGQEATVLAKLDIAAVANRAAVNVPFTFLVPGTIRFIWSVSGASTRSAHAARKARALKLASGAATRSTPGAAKVKMKLSKAGRKLLRHSKKLRVTFTAAFTPATGGPAQATQTKFTLKKHKKAKKH